MSENILTLNGRAWTVSDAEVDAIRRIMAWCEAIRGLPFAPDRPSCMRPPPGHIITPARIRSKVRTELRGLERADMIETEFLASLKLDWVSFLDLEAGTMRLPAYDARMRTARRSRILRGGMGRHAS